jgi:hypothetical protein
MGYVEPNSDIELMQVQGLDNRYIHTLYFNSVESQTSFFANKVRVRFTKQSYQRANIGTLRIRTGYDSISGLNYLRFRNTPSNDVSPQARSNMWYYAFINSCTYINEQVTEVHYEIDEMQTWFIHSNALPCLVLREHTNNDTPALNLEAEPFGSEIYDSDLLKTDEHTNSDMSLVITASNVSFNKLTVYTQNNYTDGFYNPTTLMVKPIPQGTDSEIKEQLGEYTKQLFDWIKGFYDSDSGEQVTPKGDILSVRMFYTDYANLYTMPDTPNVQSEDGSQKHYRLTVNKPTEYDNFVPQNKKMLTYPFSFLVCTSGAGSAQQYKWEYFDGNSANFDSYGCVTGEPIVSYIPLDYEGQTENIDQRFSITDFPMCPFSYDAFQAWMASSAPSVAKNARDLGMISGGVTIATSLVSIATGLYLGAQVPNSIIMNEELDKMIAYRSIANSVSSYSSASNVISSALQSEANIATAQLAKFNNALAQAPKVSGIIGGALGMYSAYKNYEYTFANAKYQPRVVVGHSGGSQLFGSRLPQTRFYHAHIRDDEAKRVDEQLTMYGYATNRVKVPNFSGRRYWNFVKTQGCTVSGNAPGDSLSAIGKILDSGITFWHGDYVGNYRIGFNGDVITNPIS